MVRLLSLLCFLATSTTLDVHGGVVPAGVAKPNVMYEDPPYTRPVPSPKPKPSAKHGAIPGIYYGPENGVWHARPGGLLPKNFDDTNLLWFDAHQHRVIKKISCTHMNPDNQFLGITADYALPDGSSRVPSDYHGDSPFFGLRLRHNTYELGPHELFNEVTYRYCGGAYTGIQFGTTRPDGLGGTACGYWNITDLPNGCGGDILRPIFGHKIVGFYGDFNNIQATHDRGFRGIGIISLPRNA